MTQTHTPGPWFVSHVRGFGSKDRCTHVTARDHNSKDIAGDCPIAICHEGASHWDTKFPHQANARLIAAAPDLLDAAEAALDDMDEWLAISDSLTRAGFNMDDMQERADKLRAAIARAKGGAA
jgi:hypothetical protein